MASLTVNDAPTAAHSSPASPPASAGRAAGAASMVGSAALAANAPPISACPGLLRIVAARDGGICRLRLPGGEITAVQARAVAQASARHANGVIEATNRANLQLRGVRMTEQDALVAALIDAGLGPATPNSDDVRNLMLSPSAGIDPAALLDTRPIARALLDRLERNFGVPSDELPPEIGSARLSPKFALQLDGGEALTMLDHHHDIWLAAIPAKSVNSALAEPWLAFGLAGTVPRIGENIGPLGAVSLAHAPDLVAALIQVFLLLARNDETRMRDLLRREQAESVLARAETLMDFSVCRETSVLSWRRDGANASASTRFGAVPQLSNYRIGAQFPLGRLDSTTLQELASLADEYGDGTLRMTPWQGVILPNINTVSVDRAQARLRALGLIDTASAPLGAVLACAGNTGCAKGLADTKADARQLAALLPAPVDIHLSGCSRGCAAAHRLPHTLLATESGRYDLYDGTGTQVGSRSFGRLVAAQMTIDDAAHYLAETRGYTGNAENAVTTSTHTAKTLTTTPDGVSFPIHPISKSNA